jgi:tetratricopeptide (TPR) repeat protein
MQLVGSTDPDDVVLKRLDEAFGYFESARELDPFDATACGCLVYWHTVLGNYDTARAEAEYGLDINPSNHVIFRANGMLQLATGDNDAAIEQLKKALRLNPQGVDTMDTIANLATAVLASGNYEEGLILARQAVRGDPDNPAYQTQLIVALALLGRLDEAGAAYASALDRIPRLRMDTIWIKGWLKPLTDDMRELVEVPADATVGELLQSFQAELGKSA